MPTVTISATPVRNWDTGDTGTTGIILTYTKKDPAITKLYLALLSGGRLIGEASFDVSSLAVNTPTQYGASIPNGLTKITVVPTSYRTDTIPANTSKTYTPSAGKILVLKTARLTTNNIVDANGQIFVGTAVVPEGQTVTVNVWDTDMTVDVYEFNAADIPASTFDLNIVEYAGGSAKYSKFVQITDYPPFLVGGEGTVAITQIL